MLWYIILQICDRCFKGDAKFLEISVQSSALQSQFSFQDTEYRSLIQVLHCEMVYMVLCVDFKILMLPFAGDNHLIEFIARIFQLKLEKSDGYSSNFKQIQLWARPRQVEALGLTGCRTFPAHSFICQLNLLLQNKEEDCDLGKIIFIRI